MTSMNHGYYFVTLEFALPSYHVLATSGYTFLSQLEESFQCCSRPKTKTFHRHESYSVGRSWLVVVGGFPSPRANRLPMSIINLHKIKVI